ncbi:NAD(P)H-binding protein [Achromobacter sp. GG226]|uniref:NAD(P)H-binding protein n=1 Tax=Verticiella alkaliphila TaxID=2779529 RepID=UPI001C0AB7AE|nr:NAD(P)H-binding protein [Verticiella sp. GG226]MBU4609695.1 NAD(P)H-binding protein [Verticiella sp. GG226]
MKVLLTGSTGFIGSRLLRALNAAGHEVVCPVRRASKRETHAPGIHLIELDFAKATRAADWQAALAGVDVVINAVGILQERGPQQFETLHYLAPCALFQAAKEAGVRRVIQISALGADAQAESAYHLSKKAADDCLAGLDVDAAIVQPSLVFAPGGASARMFTFMAGLPVIPLPGRGDQRVQPVHREDLAAGVMALVEGAPVTSSDRRVPFVGPAPMTLREFYGRLRLALGKGRARFLSIPAPIIAASASAGSHVPGILLDKDTWGMLQRGNTGDPTALTALIGHPPRAVAAFFD